MSVYYIAGYPISDELYHHGIKGQRWGIRRYQNEDGSLTQAGRARYGTVDNFNKAQAYKSARKEADKAYDKAYEKSLAAWSPIKKHREDNKKRWEDVYDKTKAFEKARDEYRKSRASVKDMPEVKARNDKIKKAAIIGASVVAAAAITYGGYKLAEANPDMVTYGKYKVRQLLGKTGKTNFKPDYSDKPGDDSISRMAKASLRDIENAHAGRVPTNMNDVMKKGSSDAISRMTEEAINRSNANYAERTRRSEDVVKREQELARERRGIIDRQLEETYRILRDEQKEEKKNRRKKK